MPYKITLCGIYRITNKLTGESYVGQSRNLKKRIAEHFRLLRNGEHPNTRLQQAANTHGVETFEGVIEVLCDDPGDLDALEEAFLRGDASFLSPHMYNISETAHAPMRGRVHSDEVRQRIRLGRRAATFDYSNPEYRATLARAQMARFQRDPKFIGKLKFILDNPDMSYAARARALGSDTSPVRRLALKYQHLKGTL